MSDKVKRWWPILDRWCVELGVSQSLVLAVIHMESGGNENARRYEPAFEKRYILGSSAWLKRCKELGISTRDAATSYGLMQLMFMTAWGYGCRSIEQLLDPGQNIRFGVAHLASLLDRCGSKEAALAAYNGGMGAVTDIKNGVQTAAARYSHNVMALYNRYRNEALLERPTQTERLPAAQRNYFAPSELACPCCGLNRTKPELLEMLNTIREAIGKPLEINSSTRCAKHNEEVHGVPNSSHRPRHQHPIMRCFLNHKLKVILTDGKGKQSSSSIMGLIGSRMNFIIHICMRTARELRFAWTAAFIMPWLKI